jgi:hypothetical protein
MFILFRWLYRRKQALHSNVSAHCATYNTNTTQSPQEQKNDQVILHVLHVVEAMDSLSS